jgi:hypothetical protein
MAGLQRIKKLDPIILTDINFTLTTCLGSGGIDFSKITKRKPHPNEQWGKTNRFLQILLEQ